MFRSQGKRKLGWAKLRATEQDNSWHNRWRIGWESVKNYDTDGSFPVFANKTRSLPQRRTFWTVPHAVSGAVVGVLPPGRSRSLLSRSDHSWSAIKAALHIDRKLRTDARTCDAHTSPTHLCFWPIDYTWCEGEQRPRPVEFGGSLTSWWSKTSLNLGQLTRSQPNSDLSNKERTKINDINSKLTLKKSSNI